MKYKVIFKTQMIFDALLSDVDFHLKIIFDNAGSESFLDTTDLTFKTVVN
ncbi:hypothetical protein SAMN05421760_103131 [Neptunomonas antarctica]|uniref:Uncharacterized protein n=1 Tax=Neptunomonas antarctica TaxID=619304 RepID=A0A1N7L0T3_9GAMM|nr:hypothetical protein SAMN05421760_103131 [Neptunomonas antarctica]